MGIRPGLLQDFCASVHAAMARVGTARTQLGSSRLRAAPTGHCTAPHGTPNGHCPATQLASWTQSALNGHSTVGGLSLDRAYIRLNRHMTRLIFAFEQESSRPTRRAAEFLCLRACSNGPRGDSTNIAGFVAAPCSIHGPLHCTARHTKRTFPSNAAG